MQNSQSKTAHLNHLYSVFWEINYLYFGGILPPIDLKFSKRLQTTGGQYFKKPARIIQISERYFQFTNAWQEIRDTLGHEMVHYWLDFHGLPCGHTPTFYKKLRECGFNRYSRLSPVRAKFIYTCPNCNLKYFRKKRGIWSCGPCSGKKFNHQFKLVLAKGEQSLR